VDGFSRDFMASTIKDREDRKVYLAINKSNGKQRTRIETLSKENEHQEVQRVKERKMLPIGAADCHIMTIARLSIHKYKGWAQTRDEWTR
jgi:hypothetical protein